MTSRFWWNHENTQLFVTSLSSSYSFVAAHILLYLAMNSEKLLPAKKKKKSEKPRKKNNSFRIPTTKKNLNWLFNAFFLSSLCSHTWVPTPLYPTFFFSCYLLPLSKKENSILNMNLDNTSYVQIVWRKTIQILTINLGKKTTMVHVN